MRRLSVAQMLCTTKPTDRTWHDQYTRSGYQLTEIWRRFERRALLRKVRPENIHLVVEDFILRPVRDSQRHTLSPVYISSAMLGIWHGQTDPDGPLPIYWSSPSLLSSLPQEGLKQAQLWTVGHEHARSATIHALAHARKLGYSGLLSARDDTIRGYFPTNE